MTKDKLVFQVLIIGGGPAGIATSLTLSTRGIPHCIVEALPTPAWKPGEAIPPTVKPLLKQLGILPLLDNDKHLVYYGNRTCWGTSDLEERDFIQELHGPGYLLDRVAFEQDLQQLVQKETCTFFKGFRLKQIVNATTGLQIEITDGSQTQQIKGAFVVDATGRKASVCRHLGLIKRAWNTQFAIVFKASFSERMERKIHVEAVENGWWYMAPQNETALNIMFFTKKEILPTKDKISTFIKNEFNKTKHLSKLLTNCLLLPEKIQIRPAGTSYLPIPYGKNWIAVGDAAYSYDPISSYGITSALAGGLYAGHAIADFFAKKKEAMPTYRYIMENTFQAYLQKLVAHYALEKRWLGTPYWTNN